MNGREEIFEVLMTEKYPKLRETPNHKSWKPRKHQDVSYLNERKSKTEKILKKTRGVKNHLYL